MGLWAGVKFLVKETITYKTVKVRRPRPGLPAKTECSFAPLTTNPERPSSRSPDARHPHRVPPPIASQLVKTYDKTLILLHLFFMSLITTYAFYSIVVSHSYMKFEKPTTSVTQSIYRDDFDDLAGNAASTLPYCVGTGNDLVDYVSVANDTYKDPQCVRLDAWEFTQKDANALWVNTHFRQRTVTRTCPGKDGTEFKACTETVSNVRDAFIAGPEHLALDLSFTVTATFGLAQPPAELIIRKPDGSTVTHSPGLKNDAARLTIGDILSSAGIDLDAQSPTAAGKSSVFASKRAPHRLMGVHLRVKLESTNTNPDPWRPFDTTLRTFVSVEFVPTKEMFGPATHVYYVGGHLDFDDNEPSLQSHDQVRVERHWSGVYIEYESGGEVGKVDLITTMMAITNAFVLIGMATAIVDNIGQLISARFYDDKYEDDGEREILENIASQLEEPGHLGVPFDPKNLRLMSDDDVPGMNYEDAMYNIMNQIREIEDRLSMIPEEEGEFVEAEGGGPSRQPDGYPPLYLVEEISAEKRMKALEEEEEEPEPAEILLYPGVQMMGRGCGNVLSKAVSRQQFTLTVVKDKVRMKALRDGPGYMKDGVGRFEPLKMGKAVVLTVGDKVVFRMREGKQGGHLGVHTILEEGGEEKEVGWLESIRIQLGC